MRFAFQVRQKLERIDYVLHETENLEAKSDWIDPKISPRELEWFTNCIRGVIITGIMVKIEKLLEVRGNVCSSGNPLAGVTVQLVYDKPGDRIPMRASDVTGPDGSYCIPGCLFIDLEPITLLVTDQNGGCFAVKAKAPNRAQAEDDDNNVLEFDIGSLHHRFFVA